MRNIKTGIALLLSVALGLLACSKSGCAAALSQEDKYKLLLRLDR